jgi:Cap4-like dsDNA endonuclease family protein
MGDGKRLHEVEPREQVGAQTGARYDYQYHQAAAHALALLDDTHVVCIFCEWHDDYVTEAASEGGYVFHQVKTRQKSKGPWPLSEFFGLPRQTQKSRSLPAAADSIFGRLWDHTQKFADECSAFVFVTDAGVSTEFENLLADAEVAADCTELSAESAPHFARVRDAVSQTFASVTEAALFDFLKHTTVQDAVGSVADLVGCRVLIASRILLNSEVDLVMSEARKIGAELVSAVRARSHVIFDALPGSADELRAKKGLVLDDVLRLLSLSTEGYRQLKTGGRESVLALSRLHRLCARNGVPESLIPELCSYKTGWDAWWLDQRHSVEPVDYLTLKGECAELLKAHGAGELPIDGLVAQAKLVCEKYRKILMSSEPLRAELIVGFIIALAVEAEA